MSPFSASMLAATLVSPQRQRGATPPKRWEPWISIRVPPSTGPEAGASDSSAAGVRIVKDATDASHCCPFSETEKGRVLGGNTFVRSDLQESAPKPRPSPANEW